MHLGCEYHVNREIIPNLEQRRVLPLAQSEYVLTEYAHESEESYVCEMSMELLSHGYIPVIAHVERPMQMLCWERTDLPPNVFVSTCWIRIWWMLLRVIVMIRPSGAIIW